MEDRRNDIYDKITSQENSWFFEEQSRIAIYTFRHRLKSNFVGKISYRKLANVLRRAGWNVSKSK